MDWAAVGVGVTAGIALVGFNGWVMNLVISKQVEHLKNELSREFVTKEHLSSHERTCPHQYNKIGVE